MKRHALIFVFALVVGISGSALAQVSPAAQPSSQATSQDQEFRKKVNTAATDYNGGKLDLAAAVKTFEGLLTEKSDDADVQSWLGFLYLRADRAADAVPLLEKAAKAKKDDLEVRTNLANAYAGTKQFDLALQAYSEVIDLKPSMAEPYYNRGVIYLQQKMYGKALGEFQKAADRKPEDPFIQNNIGVSFENQNDRVNAADAFKKASDLRADNKVFAKNAAMALTRLRRTSEALPYWERLNRLDPSDLQAIQAIAEEYGRQKNAKQAVKYYEQLKEKMAGNPTFWYNLGVFRDQTGDTDGAADAYGQVLKLSENDLDAMNNLGLINYRKGDFKSALTMFEKLDSKTKSISVKQSLGASAIKCGESEKAVKAWKEILRMDPTRKDIRILVGDACFAKNDYDGAAVQYKMVLKSDAGSAQANNGLGLIALKNDQLVEAEKSFRAAVKAKPDYIPGYNNLAITLERANKRKAAIQVLQKALSIDSGNADVKANLDRMKSAE